MFKRKTAQTEHIKDSKSDELLKSSDDVNTYLSGVHTSLLWYKKQYATLIKTTLILSATTISMLAIAVVLFMTEAKPIYFAQTPDLRLTKLVPLSEPYISDETVVNFTALVATETLSLDFLHYKNDLMRVRHNYSEKAFSDIVHSLKSSGIIDIITEDRVAINATLENPPVITASGPLKGKYSWKIEFPMILSYETSKGLSNTQHLNVTAIVQRADTLTHPKGVVISQILMAVK